MKLTLAIRLCDLLQERGLSCSIHENIEGYYILWWEHDMGEQHRITPESLLADQHWLDREVIK